MRRSQPFQHSLPVPPELSRAPIYLTNAGWERIAIGQPYPPREQTSLYEFKWEDGRVLPEFCLVWAKGGSGVLEVAGGEQRIPRKRAFFVRPGEWHRHRPDPEIGWTIYWIHFNGDLARQWMLDDEFDMEENLPVIKDTRLFEAQFERLLHTVERAPTTNTAALSCQAAGLLSHMSRSRDEHRDELPVQPDPLVNQAVQFIWNHHQRHVGVPEVVAHVGTGRRSLERRFTAVLGRSVLDEIQMCRLSRAKRLLQYSSVPIKQIVHLAGLRSRNQLWLLFKEHVGMSPDEYRQGFPEGEGNPP